MTTTDVETRDPRAGVYVRVRGWAIRRLARTRGSASGRGAQTWRTPRQDQPTTSTRETSREPGQNQDLQLGHGWSAGAHWTATAVRTAVWVAVLCGPVALVAVLATGPSGPPVVQSAPTGDAAGERAAVGEFAERFVTTWVETDNDSSARLNQFVRLPDTLSWPTQPVGTAGAATVSQIGEQSNELWSVTVGTDVTPTGADSATRRFFRVAVRYDEGALVAVALPTPVPTPPRADPPETAYANEVALDSAPGETIASFLEAMLTGRGEVSRYISPGSGIKGISSAPYTSVEIAGIGADRDLMAESGKPDDDDRADVLVTAKATADSGAATVVQYALSLRSRDGRWEVAAIGLTPQVTDSAGNTLPTDDTESGTD